MTQPRAPSSGRRGTTVRRYDGPAHGDDAAVAVTDSSDGARLFVTGESPGSGSAYDYATIAYAAG
jgi:hypothetical protein